MIFGVVLLQSCRLAELGMLLTNSYFFQDGLREEELLQHMKSVHIEGAIQVNILFELHFVIFLSLRDFTLML
jgi:hypothetical protein